MERFWDKVKKGPGCWEWTAGRTDKKYGRFCIGSRTNGSRGEVSAHRFSWQLHFGEIPKDMCVCHKCDNPPCVRPDHLFLGTPEENRKDMISKGRQAKGDKTATQRGEKAWQTTLTEKDVLKIREMYKSGTYTFRSLAKELGLSKTTVGYIVSRMTWKHI